MLEKRFFKGLQSALLIKDVWKPWNSFQTASLLSSWCKSDIVEQVELGFGVVARLEVEQQIVLDGEDGIVGDVLVVTGVQLGDQRLVAFS